MSKRLISALVLALALLPCRAEADSWTDGQAEWARHGFKHGAWDCYGDCPSGKRPEARPASRPRAARPSFDGTWVVSADGPCSGAGSSQVTILGGRIVGPNGGGHVTPGGVVETVGNINGMTVIGHGQIVGRVASGSYHQSDGCSSSWSAVKL